MLRFCCGLSIIMIMVQSREKAQDAADKRSLLKIRPIGRGNFTDENRIRGFNALLEDHGAGFRVAAGGVALYHFGYSASIFITTGCCLSGHPKQD